MEMALRALGYRPEKRVAELEEVASKLPRGRG